MDLNTNLSKEEIDILEGALPLITVLVGAADGKIDEKELNWAQQLAEIRTFFGPDELHPLYSHVAISLYDDVKTLLDELPGDVDRRQKEISSRLSAVNPILKKLDNLAAKHLYDSMKTFAKKIAQSSGGIFGAFSISLDELEVIDLDMIDPVG